MRCFRPPRTALALRGHGGDGDESTEDGTESDEGDIRINDMNEKDS